MAAVVPSPRSTPGPRPVAQQSIVELVIDEVRRSILDGSLPPGSPVSIADLSGRLNVSHIPVREALRRLEGEGLVELRRGRSAVVAPLSATDLADVFDLRALIEGDLMAAACKRYTDADLLGLQAAYDAIEVRPGDDSEAISQRHTDFHRLLVAPASTEWSGRVLEMLWQAGDRYMYLIIGAAGGPPSTALRDEHDEILAAALARDARAARKAVKAHTDSGIGLIGPLLKRAAGA
jgi:DNA-binding GntR family transcriptional regulator